MAPKTSLFPPNRQKIKRAEEVRKNQIKTMGDLEFTADMQPQFVGQMTQEQKDFIGGENPEKSKFREIFTYLDDPIAQYGFDPDRIRLQEPDKYQIQNVWSSKQPTTTDANAEYNPGYTKTGPNRLDIEKDIIKYGVKLGSSKEIIAHEARHRGFQLLRDMQLEGSEEDQKAWIEKYGREAAGLLDIYFSRDPRHKFSAETINEIRDRPDAKFNSPKFDAEGNPPNMGLFREGDRNAAIQFVPTEDLRKSKKSGRIQFSGDFTDLGGNLRASLSNEFINKAFQGLDKAAKDAMKKQKDDYRNKMTVRSQEGKRKFAQGGVAMKDQMEMNFGKAETVDPVSGNDVPPGSLPIEVRDNIPARLSEGEYVVPADVVRYFGVRVFEQMRAEAKMGLQQMDADGRIGGEPIEPQQAQLSDDDLNSIIEQAMQQEQPMMANKGGVVGYKYGGYQAPDYITDFLGSSLFGGDTSANEFYNVDDYKPTTGEYGTPEEAAPAVTVNVPDPVCPPGQVYNRAKQMCVPKEESDGPSSTSGDETTASTSFGLDEEGNFIDFTDPEAVLEYAKSFDTPVLGGALGDSDTLRQIGLAGSLAGIPAIGAVAGLASLGNKIGSTTDIAGLRAARMTAAIYGHDDVVKQIEGVIAGYEGGTGFTKGGKFGDAITTNDAAKGPFGTGYGYGSTANGVNKKDLKTFMKMFDDPKADKKAQEKLRNKLKNTSISTRSRENRLNSTPAELARRETLALQAAKSAKVETAKRKEAQERAARAAAAARSAQQIKNANAAELARRQQQMEDSSDDYFDSGSSYKGETTVSGAIDKMKEEGDFNVGGRATGGLVQKRKKKKK